LAWQGLVPHEWQAAFFVGAAYPVQVPPLDPELDEDDEEEDEEEPPSGPPELELELDEPLEEEDDDEEDDEDEEEDEEEVLEPPLDELDVPEEPEELVLFVAPLPASSVAPPASSSPAVLGSEPSETAVPTAQALVGATTNATSAASGTRRLKRTNRRTFIENLTSAGVAPGRWTSNPEKGPSRRNHTEFAWHPPDVSHLCQVTRGSLGVTPRWAAR
jgi:hypothetical protein